MNSNLSTILGSINGYKAINNPVNNTHRSIGQEAIDLFKKGNKIHIKKKNRGSFTRWCGGNVTEECIKRGKNSPNPAIRKKATFAANSRKWNKS